MNIKSGDFVVRQSYDGDIIFKVKQIYKDEDGSLSAVLKGVDIRLIADAPMVDLKKLDDTIVTGGGKRDDLEELDSLILKRNMRTDQKLLGLRCMRGDEVAITTKSDSESTGTGDFFDFPGRVLHLDGDAEYLEKCRAAYDKFKIPNDCLMVPERDQPNAVTYYLEKYHPGILVITGHDSLLKGAKDLSNLDNYRSSSYFVEAVNKARQYQPDQDALVIFAGACQSNYEELLKSGANFASSPRRVFIHIYDPVLVIERIAYTSIKDVLTVDEIIDATVTGSDGVGGIETRGQLRLGYPRGSAQ